MAELKISKYRTFTLRTKLQAVLDVQSKKISKRKMLRKLSITKRQFKGWVKNLDVLKQMAQQAISKGRAQLRNRVRISGSGPKTKYPALNKHMNKWWAEHKV